MAGDWSKKKDQKPSVLVHHKACLATSRLRLTARLKSLWRSKSGKESLKPSTKGYWFPARIYHPGAIWLLSSGWHAVQSDRLTSAWLMRSSLSRRVRAGPASPKGPLCRGRWTTQRTGVRSYRACIGNSRRRLPFSRWGFRLRTAFPTSSSRGYVRALFERKAMRRPPIRILAGSSSCDESSPSNWLLHVASSVRPRCHVQ
jgi:hypothetical protein